MKRENNLYKYILNNYTLNANLVSLILQKSKFNFTEFSVDINDFTGEEKE